MSEQLIKSIQNKCVEVQDQIEFVKTLVGKALDPKWPIADPDYTYMKAMAQVSIDLAAALVVELQALIPE